MRPTLSRLSNDGEAKSRTGQSSKLGLMRHARLTLDRQDGFYCPPSGAAKSTTVTPGQSVQSEQSSRCCWTKLFLGVGIPLRLSHFMHIRLVLYGLNTSYSPTCFKLVQYVNGAAVVVWGILFACALNRWCCRCLYAEQPWTEACDQE